MDKEITIIGSGMGGLASGIYARLNGYRATIFEQHALPGGQCASWKRKGYTLDGCIHHLMGCEPGSRLYTLWEELGVMPRELAATKECVSVASPEGRMFLDYYDTEALEQHLKDLSPRDASTIEQYARAIPRFARYDLMGEAMMGTRTGLLKMLPGLLGLAKWFRPNMEQFAGRFRDPFLRRAFPLLEYSIKDMPFFMHLAKHAYGYRGGIEWPVGASIGLARSMEKRFLELGGEVHYRSGVERVLTEGGKATGVILEDGSEHRSDIVISNADGRKTIIGMLGGRFINESIRKFCRPPLDDETPWAVHVFLGVARDLSDEPSALVQLLEEPVTIAGHMTDSLEMQMYGFDPTIAPQGKGVIKVELVSSYSKWKELYSDKKRYDWEKERVAEQVIDVLESTHFPGIRGQIEVVDVPTMMTWERFMGGSYGFMTGPAKKFSPMDMFFGKGYSTLPGLSNFYLVGTWATATGALFANARSGRRAIQAACESEGKSFVSR
ncbi:MAG: NAD(P)/FAD-dependent oxidoreductase [Actinobacteria bacterium]|nr:NAD(P)/FAD-dependent oxidoreductase [Actinomycetota bacterium]